MRGILLAILALASRPIAAQCAASWSLLGTGLQGPAGPVRASELWDPDGAGPMAARLIVGGLFTGVGNCVASNVAAWDPVTGQWSALGSGLGTNSVGVWDLCTMPNGDLIACGDFTTAGAVTTHRIARWNGTSWSPIGSGMNGLVTSVAVTPFGDLVAGGTFTAANGLQALGIALWNGTQWFSLGGGLDGIVNAIAVMPNGDLVAGGDFTLAGGQPANRVAKWNGLAWSALGTGVDGPVHALTVLPNGDLVVGGTFLTAGGGAAPRLARWDGSAWSSMGAVAMASPYESPIVSTLVTASNGDLLVGGVFDSVGGVPASRIARWNGTAWSSLGSGVTVPPQLLSDPTNVNTLLVLPNGDIVAGGRFAQVGGQWARRLARWNGSVWSALAPGWEGTPYAMTELSDGTIVAGGNFELAAGTPASRIARFDGVSWSPLGNGLSGAVYAVLTMPNGDVVAGGTFPSGVQRWDGVSWTALQGGGVPAPYVFALGIGKNGRLVAGGGYSGGSPSSPGIAEWDGAGWSPLGGGVNNTVGSLVTLANGDLVVGGSFTSAGGIAANRVARWDGTAWSALGAGTNDQVVALIVLPDGDVVASGLFTVAGGVSASRLARWNGTAWSALGVPPPFDRMAALPNGDVIVCRNTGLFRWNGATWSLVPAGATASPTVLFQRKNGELLAAGYFTANAGATYSTIASLTTNCPATVAAVGTGCSGTGGTNTLVAETWPWVDATFRARGSGLPASALVLCLTSVTSIPQGAAPLSAAFPQAGPGCDVLVAPDILGLQLASNGVAISELFLVNTPPLLGVTFHHQMIPIGLDPQGAWTEVGATNALQLTCGMF